MSPTAQTGLPYGIMCLFFILLVSLVVRNEIRFGLLMAHRLQFFYFFLRTTNIFFLNFRLQ